MSTFSRFLDPQAIVLKAEADTPEAVIRLLGGKLQALGRVHPSFVEAVIAREATMPTGLPLGTAFNVAVPHTDPEHVIAPSLALATFDTPVVFSNMEDPDEKLPVRVVFLMALNERKRQIEMLQQIAETIQRPGAVEALAGARTVDEVWAALDQTSFA